LYQNRGETGLAALPVVAADAYTRHPDIESTAIWQMAPTGRIWTTDRALGANMALARSYRKKRG
jgi:hypothetical protein